jgi:hypothetical protein
MKKTYLFLAALLLASFLAAPLSAQTEKLGDISYTPPKGWTKTAKEHAVVFSDLNPAEGQFAFITLYAAGASEGSPQKDFAREWKARVVEPWGGEPTPKTVTEPDNGWTAIAGGSQIDFNGNKAFAFLTVTSGFGKSVALLGVLNNEAYLPQLQAFAEGMNIDKTPRANNVATTAAPALQFDSYGHLIIAPPTRQLTLADIAGNWGEAASFHQRYVYRSSGAYAGADSLTYKSKMTFTADGGFYNDFYAIQNGKMIKEKTGGRISINGRVLSIKHTNTAKYVIRGWLEMPDMTVLEVCGPWYDDDVIPQEIFNNPNQGANLNAQWVRKR